MGWGSLLPSLFFLLYPFPFVPEGCWPQSCCTHWLAGRKGWDTADVGKVWRDSDLLFLALRGQDLGPVS